MRTIDKIITTVGEYEAPCGRPNVGQRPTNQKIYDCAVPMAVDAAYDKGGVYWGIGGQLRVSYTKDLQYIEFYRKGNPSFGPVTKRMTISPSTGDWVTETIN